MPAEDEHERYRRLRRGKFDPQMRAWMIVGAATLAAVLAGMLLMWLNPDFVPPCHDTYYKARVRCPPATVQRRSMPPDQKALFPQLEEPAVRLARE